MPCMDGGPTYEQVAETHNTGRQRAEQMLCATLQYLEDKGLMQRFMSHVDPVESGVSATVIQSWWTDHKASDNKRRKIEEDAAIAKKLKEQALSKLTPAERKVLGL